MDQTELRKDPILLLSPAQRGKHMVLGGSETLTPQLKQRVLARRGCEKSFGSKSQKQGSLLQDAKLAPYCPDDH